MKWILIFYIFSPGLNGGNVVINQEFNTLEQCNVVGRYMVLDAKNKLSPNHTDYSCWSKGSTKDLEE